MEKGSTRVMRSVGLRLATATVALPILLAVVWAGNPWVGIVVGIVTVLAVRESYALFYAPGSNLATILAAIWSVSIVFVVALNNDLMAITILGIGVLVTTLGALTSLVLSRDAAKWAMAILGALYVVVPMTAILLLLRLPQGTEWLVLTFLATFAADTGAFLVGRRFGHIRLAPRISPSKTWEGAFGGLLGSIGATFGLVTTLGLGLTWESVVILGSAIAITSQIGDLIESGLKRRAGVKDSGGIFPGHGGVLDRLDSLVPVLPLVYYVVSVWVSP